MASRIYGEYLVEQFRESRRRTYGDNWEYIMWSGFMYMLQSDNCLYLLTHLNSSLHSNLHGLAGPKSVMQDGSDTTVNGTLRPRRRTPICLSIIGVVTDERVVITVCSSHAIGGMH